MLFIIKIINQPGYVELHMHSKKKLFIIIASSLTAILLVITLVLPVIVRNKAIESLQQATGRKVSIESISINPFTLSVGINKFIIEEKDSPPLISIEKAEASLGLASIYKRALILSSIEITSPAVSFTRTAPNQYSFSDIFERQKSSQQPKEGSETLFSFNNISISGGSVDFNDLAVEKGRKHTVRKLDLKVPFISNIPYMVDKYTDPSLKAEINGAEFNFHGKLKPLHKSLETSVRIDLKRLNLPELVAYSPQKPPATLKSGQLTIDTDLSYRISSDKKPELTLKGLIQLAGIESVMPDGQPLVKFPELTLQAGKLELFNNQFEIDSVVLKQLELFVSRDNKNRWTHQYLTGNTSAEPVKGKTDTQKTSEPPRVNVTRLEIIDSKVSFSDSVPKGGFRGAVEKINLNLNNFSNQKDKSAQYKLTMLLDEAPFKSSGQFTVSPAAGTANLEINAINIRKGWPYLSSVLTNPVNGTVDLSTDISFSEESGLSTNNGNISIHNIQTKFNKTDGFDLALLAVKGIGFNQKDNSLAVSDVQISRGKLVFSREQNGTLSPLLLLASQPQNTSPRPAEPVPAQAIQPARNSSDKSDPLKYSVNKLQLDRFNINFTDFAKEGRPDFSLKSTSLTVSNFKGPKFSPAQFRFATVLGKNSSIKAAGQFIPAPFNYKGDLSISQLQISDFEDYLPENLNVGILGGSFDTKLKLDFSIKDGKPSGTFSGSSGIRAFHSIDSTSDEDLLRWESLQFDSFNGQFEPLMVNINQIALNNFYSRIVVLKNGTLNLQNLVDKPEPGPMTAKEDHQQKADSAASPHPKLPATSSSTAPKIKVGAITIQGGTLNFTDSHLPQHFATTFFNLGGRVSGLSSEDNQMADVDLRGNLENHSPLQITGKINPLREDLFVDLKISFKDIELSPVTPYSGTFLGYSVEKGKLFLDLKYHIENKALNSDNKIFIDQFTFGNKVESDKATNLPVKLGLALLKDRKGEIHLDVPVTGRTDDPQFSIWKLVFQVLKNLLLKAATSPFSLLSSMFGGGEDLSTVQFETGSSTLRTQEELKLNALSKALADRPALKLELKAYVDRDRDAEGYKIELLNRKIRNEKYLALVKNQQAAAGGAEAVKVLPEEYSTYLKSVYKKEKFPKPRNMIGLVKDIPDSEMKKLIITNTVVGSNELRTLAQERNSAVMNYLINKGNLDSQRVFQKIDDITKKPQKEGTPGSRVELNAIVQ
jgi:hypothetical protein